METVMPGIPLAPPPSSDNTPAVATPPPKPGSSPEAMLDAIKAKVKQGLTPPPPTKKPETPVAKSDDNTDTKPDDQKPETDLNVPKQVLRELGRLQTRVRELEPKIKEYDALKPDADLAREVKKLWSGTHEDKIKALSVLSGKDGLDELAWMVKAYYETEQNSDPNAQPASPEVKDLKKMIEDQGKIIAELKAGIDKEKETESSNKATEASEKAAGFVKGLIDTSKTKFELCARPENIKEAVSLAQDAAIKLIELDINGYDQLDEKGKTAAFAAALKQIGPEESKAIYMRALAEVEKEFEITGKRFSKSTPEPRGAFNPDRYRTIVRPLTKPPVVVKDEELSKNPEQRFKQIAERARAKAEAGGYR